MGDNFNFDNYGMKVKATVGLPTVKDLDAQIRQLEKNISKLKVSGQFDDTALRNLTNQLDTLKATISTANFSPTALNELTNQVNKALSNINIGNINVGNVGNQASQVGQQIGQQISNGVSQGLGNSGNIIDSFRQSLSNMANMDASRINTIIGDIQNLGVTVEKLNESMSHSTGRRGAQRNILNVEVSGTDSLGNAVKMIRQYNVDTNTVIRTSQGLSAATQKSNSQLESLQAQQIKRQATLKNQLEQIYQSAISPNASRSITDVKHLEDLENQYNSIKTEISSMGGVSKTAFAQQDASVSEMINKLKIAKKNYQDMENVSTTLKPDKLASGISKLESEFKALQTDIINTNASSKKLNLSINEIQSILDKPKNGEIINKSDVESAFTSLSKAKAELKAINSETMSNASLDAMQTKAELLAKTLSDSKFNGFTTSIRESEVSATDLITKLENVKTAADFKKAKAEVDAFTTAFRNAEKASSDLKKADEIQLLSDSGQFQAQYDTLIAKTNQWTNEQGEARIATTALKQSLDELNQASDVYANNSSVENAQKLSTALEKYDAEAKKVNNSVRTMNATMAKDSAIQKLNQQIIEFMDKNPKAVKAFGKDLKNMLLQTHVGAEKTNQELDELTASFTTLKNTARSTGKLGNTFFGTIKENIKSFVPWTTGTGLIMGIANAAKGAISNVYKLDDAITDLVMATNASERQLESYIDTYIKLGDELSATVTDVTISATEWLKQGKSIAETETLIKDAMVLSKVGKMTSADATKYLTSAMKGYGVAVEDTLSIVDKMSAVDMDSATDVGGLAEGMSEVANNANLAGISMDKLLGYLATIGEVTQSSMSEVGTSLNAIFSRMGNIKLARLKDYQNNGEDLSNVETVLRGEGIALRDSASEFRNFGEVLDEVAGRWDSFSEVSQRAIASAFAGTNHMEDFLVLMQNYDTAMGYTETSMESSGQAMQKYEAYQESLAGKAERLNNALIALSDAFVESEFLGDLTEGATSAVKAITWLVDEIGVLSTAGIGLGAFLGGKNIGKYM